MQHRLCLLLLSTASVVAATAPSSGLIRVVSGTVDTDTNSVQFEHVDLMPSDRQWDAVNRLRARETSSRPWEAKACEFEMRLLAADSTVICTIPFTVSPTNHEVDDVGPGGDFTLALPDDAGIQRMVVVRNGSVIGTRTPSPHKPTVTVLTPNGGERLRDRTMVTWTSADADGDELSHTVAYSADGGVTWDVDNIWLSGQSHDIELPPSRPFPPQPIARTSHALVMVTVSDGFNVASDISDSEFTVDAPSEP